ncbi:hypothetical protein OSB04_024464 [Centaurea solstitialis]|uniref:Uncharacterized protein n=1 Tax=Centaurea solstitialis TaxID=347529 RepID=A0AA38W351_9ASTR|nr:hypothetical protein OSB04_024464 [Centaurea solstitialis]
MGQRTTFQQIHERAWGRELQLERQRKRRREEQSNASTLGALESFLKVEEKECRVVFPEVLLRSKVRDHRSYQSFCQTHQKSCEQASTSKRGSVGHHRGFEKHWSSAKFRLRSFSR